MENKRRMFIGSKGQPSAVLRSKKNESEDDARSRLTEKGWNMDAPHEFNKVTEGKSEGTGEFRVTDPKPPRKRKKKAAKSDGESKDSDVSEPAKDENKSADSKESDEDKPVAVEDASD